MAHKDGVLNRISLKIFLDRSDVFRYCSESLALRMTWQSDRLCVFEMVNLKLPGKAATSGPVNEY